MTKAILFVFCLGLLGTSESSWADHGTDRVQDSKVQETVQRVLSDPEFRHLTRESERVSDAELPEWLRNFLKWLSSWFEWNSSTSSSTSFSGIDSLLSFAALVLVVGVVLFLLISLLKKVGPQGINRPLEFATTSEELNPLTPPGEHPTAFYEQRALQFAAEGNFRAAFRELVLGGMSWTERAGRIRYRRGLTNRDYVRAIWSDRERRLSLMVIADGFDRVFFGRRPAEQHRFQLCLNEFQQSFRETLPG